MKYGASSLTDSSVRACTAIQCSALSDGSEADVRGIVRERVREFRQCDTTKRPPTFTTTFTTHARAGALVPPPSCLGGGPHRWVPVKTHSTPVRTSVRRLWVAQHKTPHEPKRLTLREGQVPQMLSKKVNFGSNKAYVRRSRPRRLHIRQAARAPEVQLAGRVAWAIPRGHRMLCVLGTTSLRSSHSSASSRNAASSGPSQRKCFQPFSYSLWEPSIFTRAPPAQWTMCSFSLPDVSSP